MKRTPRSINATAPVLTGRVSNRVVAGIAEDMVANGWHGPPIRVVDIDGSLYVVDGHHGLAAARRAGIDAIYEVVDVDSVIGAG
ncbi:ParB N-terminal domain-containing protein [Acidimicrobiaceae bacterium AH-315-P05]|nr:ParB N-terminal domain-containing protein [Acidimicrobiaceae bacterium AH-315-P05]